MGQVFRTFPKRWAGREIFRIRVARDFTTISFSAVCEKGKGERVTISPRDSAFELSRGGLRPFFFPEARELLVLSRNGDGVSRKTRFINAHSLPRGVIIKALVTLVRYQLMRHLYRCLCVCVCAREERETINTNLRCANPCTLHESIEPKGI